MMAIKSALIGCGGIAGAHVKALADLHERGVTEAPQVVAVCDIDESRAQERAAELAAFGPAPRVYDDIEQLLAVEDEVEAVDICALHSEHHTLAEAALASGRHVIIEKPLGITIRAARRIIDTAVATRRVLAVAENYRRSPMERAVNWAIRAGRIGQPRLFLWQDVGEGLGKWGWRNFRYHAGGGWVLDGGVHFTDLFRYHLGQPARSVYAVTRQFEPYRYERSRKSHRCMGCRCGRPVGGNDRIRWWCCRAVDVVGLLPGAAFQSSHALWQRGLL
jgi:predicted dehydrogenase